MNQIYLVQLRVKPTHFAADISDWHVDTNNSLRSVLIHSFDCVIKFPIYNGRSW